ncbi:MFS transporter [Streptomyces specialis]|uniref:MFS transporter n=1 Tax=Streptomyces specialis TaxID=498367 RepID=UPI00073F2A70|nr:MFS transporter [Streptomyces specialis]
MTVTASPAAPAPPRPPAGRTRAVPALMSACVVLCVALVAAVNLAVPQLAGSSLKPSSGELLWIVDAYVIVFACLLIPAGALGDRLGRKGALITGLAVFAAGCALSALAPGTTVLIAARAVTGVGAALIMPATLSLTLQAAAPERRAHAIALWTAASGAAGALGNIGGGLAMEYLSWRGLFWSVVPLTLALLALTAWLAPRGERHPAHADPVGTALFVLAFMALLYGVIEGPGRGWGSPAVLGAFGAAALLLAAFTVHALRAAQPLFDPRVFAVRRLRAGVLGLMVTFFGLFALFFVNAQYLQYAKGYSPVVTGLAVGPLALGMLVVARRGVGLVARYGTRRMVGIGLVVLAVGLALLSLADADTPYVLYAGVLLVMALGMGLSMPALSGAIVGALPHARAGLGSGLNGAAREIGSALGVAVMGTVLAGRFDASLPPGVPDGSAGQALAAAREFGPQARAEVIGAFTDAMGAGFRVVAGVVGVLALLVLFWFGEDDG